MGHNYNHSVFARLFARSHVRPIPCHYLDSVRTLQAEEEAREAPEARLQRELRSVQQRATDLEAENILLADKLLETQVSTLLPLCSGACKRLFLKSFV